MQTEDLSIGYKIKGGKQVLFEGLNLRLNPRELVCFMGPNGIGKSTLMRTIAGLHPPLAGQHTEVDEKTVGLVLTERVIASNMTVRELVGFGRYPYLGWSARLANDDHLKIDQAIAQTGVGDLAQKKISELSDGQMQMVMIARALAQETPVLLLDEPTSHLDLNNRVAVMKLLQRLARQTNKAILVATHELDLALQMADVIWLATNDKKIVSGMPEDLVLSGAFDEVFQLKGFDLKTGRVFHEPFRNQSVKLEGTGSVYLWTKNALERNGYSIHAPSNYTIEILDDKWRLNGKDHFTLQNLLADLSHSLR